MPTTFYDEYKTQYGSSEPDPGKISTAELSSSLKQAMVDLYDLDQEWQKAKEKGWTKLGKPEWQTYMCNSAWRQYLLARIGTARDAGGKKVNIIGRLAKHQWWPTRKVKASGGAKEEWVIPDGVEWEIDEDGQRMIFQDRTLQTLDDAWTFLVNDAWILGGVHAKKDFLIVSPVSWYNLWDMVNQWPTVTAREVVGVASGLGTPGLAYKLTRHEGKLIRAEYQPPDPESDAEEPTLAKYNEKWNEYFSPADERATRQELWGFFTQQDPRVTIHASDHALVRNKDASVTFTRLPVSAGQQSVDVDFPAVGGRPEELQKIEVTGNTLDLRGANLESVDLSGFRPPEVGGRPVRVDLTQANLLGAKLQGAWLHKADLRWATIFDGGELAVEVDGGTRLARANLSDVRGRAGDRVDQDRLEQLVGQLGKPPRSLCWIRQPEGQAYMRDNLEDNGSTPADGTYFYESPDILFSGSQIVDPNVTFGGVNWDMPYGENPQKGRRSFIYLRLDNIGSQAIRKIEGAALWYVDWSTNSWANFAESMLKKIDDNFTIDLEKQGGKLRPGEKRVWGPVVWQAPGAGSNHYCLVCDLGRNRLEQQQFASWKDFRRFVRDHNEVTWRNVFLADPTGDAKPSFKLFAAPTDVEERYALRVGLDESGTPRYPVTLDLDFSTGGKKRLTIDSATRVSVDGAAPVELKSGIEATIADDIALKRPASLKVTVSMSTPGRTAAAPLAPGQARDNALTVRFSQYFSDGKGDPTFVAKEISKASVQTALGTVSYVIPNAG